MNIASLTLCYPSRRTPHAGLFIRRRLRSLAADAHVRVINPLPTPFWSALTVAPDHRGATGGLPASAFQDTASNRWYQESGPPPSWHIPMPYLPLIGKPLNPFAYARAVLPLLSSWARQGRLDIIDAHFSWPDGVAAAKLARTLRVPYTVTLRGVLPRYARDYTKRGSIIRSLKSAAAVIAVSDSLKRLAVRLGVPESEVHVIPNGVDGELFKPGDRNAARAGLGRSTDEVMLVTVGHLCRRKGFHRVLALLPDLLAHDPKIRYVIVGADGAEGPFESHLRRLAQRLDVADRITFTGPLQPPEVARWLQAADLFVLPTTNEGCCNALTEAVATGLPVVCTDVGGNREQLPPQEAHGSHPVGYSPTPTVTPVAGMIIPSGDPRALFDAIIRTLRMWHRFSTGAPRTSLVCGTGVQSGTGFQPVLRPWSQVARETAAVLSNAAHQTSRVSPVFNR